MTRALVLAVIVAAAAPAHAFWGNPGRVDGRDPRAVYAPRSVTAVPEAGGMHWRFETWRGPVHVWLPDGYDRDDAGVVVYVHGYYTPIDRAWKEHRLASQFAASKLKAAFIAPEAPQGGHEGVFWADLGVLLGEVEKRLQEPLGKGPLIAMGHSGAYRTLLSWIAYRPLADVVMLDALYDGVEVLQEWLKATPWVPAGQGNQGAYGPSSGKARRASPRPRVPPAHKRLLLVVARSTAELTAELILPLRRLAVRVGAVPASPRQLTAKMRTARVLVLKSQFGHFEIVTSGQVIPVILNATRLGALAR